MQAENKNVIQKIKCECGQIISAKNLSTHKKGQRHMQNLEMQEGSDIMRTLKTLETKFDLLLSVLLEQSNLVYSAAAAESSFDAQITLRPSHDVDMYVTTNEIDSEPAREQYLNHDKINKIVHYLDSRLQKLTKYQERNIKLNSSQIAKLNRYNHYIRQIMLELPSEKQEIIDVILNELETKMATLINV